LVAIYFVFIMIRSTKFLFMGFATKIRTVFFARDEKHDWQPLIRCVLFQLPLYHRRLNISWHPCFEVKENGIEILTFKFESIAIFFCTESKKKVVFRDMKKQNWFEYFSCVSLIQSRILILFLSYSYIVTSFSWFFFVQW
jgi:hypothetical protein